MVSRAGKRAGKRVSEARGWRPALGWQREPGARGWRPGSGEPSWSAGGYSSRENGHGSHARTSRSKLST